MFLAHLGPILRALAGGPSPDRSPLRLWAEAALWGFATGVFCYGITLFRPGAGANDFGISLHAARCILENRSPYYLEPTLNFVPYPLTAGLLALPFSWMPDPVAGSVFIGLAAGAMCAGFLRAKEDWRILALLSWNSIYTIWWMQWSFVATALWYFPFLAILALAKPQTALPMIAIGSAMIQLLRERRWLWMVLPVVLFLVSLAIDPVWIPTWLDKIALYTGRTPPLFSLPFGPLILISLLAWRDRRCWLILAMAAVPQRMAYDQMPLLLAASRPAELGVFIASSWINFALYRFYFEGWDKVPGGWQNLVVPTLYLPMALVVAWPALRRAWSGSAMQPSS